MIKRAREFVIGIIFCSFIIGNAAFLHSDPVYENISELGFPAGDFHCFKIITDEEGYYVGCVYGSDTGVVNVYTIDKKGKFKKDWETPELEAGIQELFLADVTGNGKTEIIVYTLIGDIYIFDFESHNLIFKTEKNKYNYISAMIIHQMDDDPQKELLFIAYTDRHSVSKKIENAPAKGEPRMYIYDVKARFEEWESTEQFIANRIFIGDVDGDDEEEIVLDTGAVLDKNFRTLEWRANTSFGERLGLMDMDGDGILEIICEYKNGSLKIFDVDEKNEKW